MSEIINRPEKLPKKQRHFDYIIPGLRDMIEFAAARTVGPRDVPTKIYKLMGYENQNSYNMKFVEFKDEVPKELSHIGISKGNLYDFCRLLKIPFGFFYQFNIYDKSDGELSEGELMDLLLAEESAERNRTKFEKLIIEFWESLDRPFGYQNLARIAEQASPNGFVSIAPAGERGVAPVSKSANSPTRNFKFEDPYVIDVRTEHPQWHCALMELKDDQYVTPTFVMVHGPELERTNKDGNLTVGGSMGPPSGRYKILSFLFDPNLAMVGWSEVSAGSECPNSLISQIVTSLSNAPQLCRLMISDPYEVRPR